MISYNNFCFLNNFIKNRSSQEKFLKAMEEFYQDWQNALREFSLADQEITDYIIYKINATERRYMAMLNQAKKQGLTAWSAEQIRPVLFSNTENNAED